MSYHVRPVLKCDECGAIHESPVFCSRNATGPAANTLRSDAAFLHGWKTLIVDKPKASGRPFPSRIDLCDKCRRSHRYVHKKDVTS